MNQRDSLIYWSNYLVYVHTQQHMAADICVYDMVDKKIILTAVCHAVHISSNDLLERPHCWEPWKNNNVHKKVWRQHQDWFFLFKIPLNLAHNLFTDTLKYPWFNWISLSSFKFHMIDLPKCLAQLTHFDVLLPNIYCLERIHHLFQYTYIESSWNWSSLSIHWQNHYL